MKLKFTKAQRTRLTKLADYLEKLSKRYQHFEMASFFRRKNDDEFYALEAKYALENGGVNVCGTNACAVGHGPSAGILFPKRLVGKSQWNPNRFTIDWNAYAKLFVGDYQDDDDNYNENSRLAFDWMFGERWSTWNRDNHHWGAAARIRYALAGRDVPDDEDDFAKKLYREFDKRYAK